MPVSLPMSWNGYIIRDPSGTVRRRGAQGSAIDVTDLTTGRYQIGSIVNPLLRAELIVSADIPGGYYLIEDRGNGQLAVSFDTVAYNGPFRVTTTSENGVTSSYYAYGASNILSLGPGNWTITMARPGEAGVASRFGLDGSGKLTSVNAVSVIKPVLLDYASDWATVSIADADAGILRSEAGVRSIDASGLASGKYAITGVLNGRVRREALIVCKEIAGGAVAFEQAAPGSPIEVTIGNFVQGTTYRLLVYSASTGQSQTFYVYRSQTAFSLPSGGDWTFSLAEPGQAGLVAGLKLSPTGFLESVDGLALPTQRLLAIPAGTTEYYILDPEGNVVRSAQQAAKADFSGLKDGRYVLKFGLSDTTQFDIVVSGRLPGGVMSYEQIAPGGRMQLTLSGVTNSSPVLLTLYSPGAGVRAQFYAYDNNVSLNVPEGSWLVKVVRPSEIGYEMALTLASNGELVSLENEAISVDRKLSLPNSWSGFVLADPSGKIVRQSGNATQLDFTGLPDGRYSISRPGTRDDRRDVIISKDIPGEVAFLRQTTGPAILSFIDPIQAPYHLAQIYDAQDKLVSSFYIYGDELGLNLQPGDYRVSIATVGTETFEVHVSIGFNQTILSLNGVDVLDKPDWFAGVVKPIPALSPITYNSGLAHLNMLGRPDDSYLVQIRNESTRSVSTYKTALTDFALPLIDGSYSWRAFVLPKQEISTSALESFLSTQTGGWTQFDQSGYVPITDYVLGLEPDRVKFSTQLHLNYPADSIVLDDGSILVSNTLGSNIYRYMVDGTLRRVAGGFSAGYTAEGDGPSVLLNSPTQMQRMADGMVWIVDYENHAIREYNPINGHVRTIFGSPDALDLVINANGELVSVGDVFAIGVDDYGRAFISAARAAELFGSHETKIIRQDASGVWFQWTHDLTSLGTNYRFTDLLFSDGFVWAIVQTTNGARTLHRYSASGELTGQVSLSSQFGAGLIKDPQTGFILAADHGNIVSIDPMTLAQTSYDVTLDLNNVSSIEVDGNILTITDSDAGQILRFDTISKRIVASYGGNPGASNIYVDLDVSNGSLYALDNQTPRLIELRNGAIDVIAGTGKQQQAVLGIPAERSSLRYPGAFTIGPDGTAYIVESNHRILAIGPDSIVRPFAGNLNGGYSGDGGKASNATFQSIYGLAFNSAGNMLVADSYNHAIRSIDQNGIVQTIVGSGRAGISSNALDPNGALNTPFKILPTQDGRLFISDSWNNRVVELTADNRLVNIAGEDAPGNYQGSGSFSGDGGLAINARLNTPAGLAYHAADQTLFIVDSFNDRVRYVDSAGYIHTLIGSVRGYAAGAQLNLPSDAVLIGNDLYIADTGNGLVLKISDVDRTGNDIDNALNVTAAYSRLGHFNRAEHAGAQDADYYDMRGFGSSLLLTSEEAGLTVTFYSADGTQTSGYVMIAGEQLQILAGSTGYFQIGASQHQGYRLSLNVGGLSEALTPTSVEDNRVHLMRQDLAAFATSGASGELRGSQAHPTTMMDYYS